MRLLLVYGLLLLALPSRTVAADIVFSNSFFSLSIDSVEGTLSVASSAGDTLISSVVPFTELILPEKNDTIQIGSGKWMWTQISSEGNTLLTIRASNGYFESLYEIILNSRSEEIRFRCKTTFHQTVEVLRLALRIQMHQPLREVYRKNRLADRAFFQEEYWLGKEGARFGSDATTVFLYHTPEVSSLQLKPGLNQLLVNLDYGPDHPYQRFPLRDSLRHEKSDLSCSLYTPGDSLVNNFSIHAGKQVETVPRLMENPSGFLSAHVFTEHADWTDIRTHRAVYFGSEKITSSKKATGGFARYGIPVTKSVFYSNPDHVLNSDSRHKTIYTTPIASIQDTKGFLKFLLQLSREGHEICLHTPDQNTASRQLINAACAFMQKTFQSVTWIDHGYNNGPKNNREAFVCDGLNPESSAYAADIWKKYGLRYFWNSYYEDFATPDSGFFDFNGSLMHPYPGFGDAAPTPLYWQNPTRTGTFYSWPTRDLLEMHDPESWNFHFSRPQLEDFVRQRAIKFEHCYPAGCVEGTGYWMRNENNEVVIQTQFDKALAQLASFRDSGLINLTTVKELLGYWIACEKIRFEYTDHRSVIITNDNIFEIEGLSFAVRARSVTATKALRQKFDGDDLIFWMNLKGGESEEVSFTD